MMGAVTAGRTLIDLFKATVNRDPNKVALVFFGRKYTYKQLDDLSTEFAKYLLEDVVQPGNHVALMLPNSPQFAIAYLGILKAGCVEVALNPLVKTPEVVATLKKARPRLLITLDTFVQHNTAVYEETDIEMMTVDLAKCMSPLVSFLYRLKTIRAPRFRAKETLSWDAGVFRAAARDYDNPESENPLPQISAHDLAVLQTTGGTTGIPKLAMLTHDNLVSNTLQALEHVNSDPGRPVVGPVIGPDSVFLGVIPFFHVYGKSVCQNMAFVVGATVVILSKFEPKTVLKTMRKYKVNVFPGIPRMYNALVQDQDMQKGKYLDFGDTLKVCFSGAGPLDSAVKNNFEHLTGATIIEGYGLSEASPIVSVNPLVGGRAGSLGTVVPRTRTKIVDGELWVQGPQVMLGYLDNPEETAKVLRRDSDGDWLATGDGVRQDEQGFLWMMDRLKDMVKKNGENVYTLAIEAVIRKNSAVADVAVIGMPDPKLGEKVVACVVLNSNYGPNEETVRSVRGSCLAALRSIDVPDEVRFVKEIPKNIIGKVLKRELRQMLSTPS